MFTYIGIILLAAALFLAMILNLAARPAINARITTAMLTIAVLGGVIIYGYGFASVIPNFFLATIRTLLAVCGMFVGKNELSAISGAPAMQSSGMLFVFWLLHLFALYTSASAAITTIGAEALKQLRLLLSRRGDLILIYGCSEEAIGLGREYSGDRKNSVVFIGESLDGGAAAMIGRMGAAFRTGSTALDPDSRFIRSLGVRPGSRRVHLYCMKDESSNYLYAQKLKEAFREAGILPEQLSVTLLGQEEELAEKLQVYGDNYGYGNVFIFRRQDQAARLMIRKCPPWQNMHFDEQGRATEDFEALLIGFGSYGQSALKALVQNGQFAGSHFKATVIAGQCMAQAGYLQVECPQLFRAYDIDLREGDGRSLETFRFLESNSRKLKYIVISIGDERTSDEVAGQIRRCLAHQGLTVPVIQCSAAGIRWQNEDSQLTRLSLLSSDTMDMEAADLMAMALNHKYNQENGRTMWQDWKECDYFGRMSSRASADFIPAMLSMLHLSEEEAEAMDTLTISPQQEENLGETEHERWCAFHYTCGFRTMPREVWEQRAARHAADREAGLPKGKRTRIGKDMEARIHSCLIPWDALDELSARENAITGGSLDYKQMDKNNVLEIPLVLRLRKEGISTYDK